MLPNTPDHLIRRKCLFNRYGEKRAWRKKGQDSIKKSPFNPSTRIVRRVIEYAFSKYNYNPLRSGNELAPGILDKEIDLTDAIRAKDTQSDLYN